MLAKTIMVTLLSVCGITLTANPPAATDVSSPPTAPPDILAPDEIQDGQHFCCQSINPTAKATGRWITAR